MDPERWRRIKQLFQEALERPPATREAFLAAACGGDEPLFQHLQNLLAIHEGTSDRLEGGALEIALPTLYDELQGTVEGLRIGPYRVLSELGRGGMGAVYLAIRDDGSFEQKVAVKLIKRGMDTDEIVRRFVHERQILASLVHPHIARLLDGGTTVDGRPYFIMEAIDGRPITIYAEAEGLSVEARLRLFLEVCSAVQLAHQSLVVHRDLKPANILVDAEGAPKLLDFGIAKLLGTDGTRAQWTALDSQPMTPDYASPEQLAGQPVTTATDVYGLGLLLYELLVGRNPADLERRLGPGWRDRPASQALRALARADGQPDPARRARRLEGDLDTILQKALATEPGTRYGTAAELAADLERHLTRLPVKARRPTVAYRLSRAVLRHRVAAAFALSLVLFSAAVTWQAIEQQRLRRRAEAALTFVLGLFQAADPAQNRGAELKAREVLDAGARLLLEEKGIRRSGLGAEPGGPSSDPVTRAQLLLTIGEVQIGLGLRDDARHSLEKAVELSAGQRGREAAVAAARARTSLGFLLYESNAYEPSRRLYEQALRDREQLFGRRSLEVAEVLNGLGLLDVDTQRPQSAQALLSEALAIRRAAGPPGRVGVAQTLNNLGLLAFNQGQLDLAARSFESSSRLYRELLGEDHPDEIRVLGQIALVEAKRGDYAKAEGTYRRILQIRRRVLGPDHPDLAITLSSLGTVKENLGDLAAAAAFHGESLELRRRLSLTHDLDYADGLATMASTLLARGDLNAARECYRQALALYRELSGEGSTDVAYALSGMAELALNAGELATAEQTVLQALAIRRREYGDRHPAVARSFHLLGRVRQAAHRPAEAEVAFRQALAIRRAAPDGSAAETADSLLGLGSLLVERGELRAAEPLLLEGLATLRRLLPASHFRIGEAEGRLGSWSLAMGHREEARRQLESAHQKLAAALGEGHPETRQVGVLLRRL